MENAKPRPPIAAACLTVFLDIVGFSILFPLFPALLDHYLALEGDASALGRLAERLASLSEGDRHAVVTLFGGVLGSLYSMLQFLFAPFWGGLSDRIGRRPTLLVTLSGTVVAYVLWVFAGSFALLVASRILSGCMAGNISTATAVVADSTRPEKRAGAMGLIGMSIGLGFIFGPVLGGLFGPTDIGPASEWERGFALNPFSTAAAVATVLAFLNLALVAARLPETRSAGTSTHRDLNPFANLRQVAAPGVVTTCLIYFVFLAAFGAMEFTLTFLAVDRLDFTIRDNTWMFVFVGLLIALVQGGIVRRLAPRYGERALTKVGLVLVVPGFLAIGWTEGVGQLYAGLAAMAVGSALAMPSLSSLVSRYAPEERQGLALGTFRSMGSLSRAIGPVLGGVLYWKLGSTSPYVTGALVLAVPIVLAWRLPAPPVPDGAAGD